MPTKVYFDANATVLVKGQTRDLAFIEGPKLLRWFRRTIKAVATNGHELEIVKNRVLCYEYQLDAEFDKAMSDQRKAQEEAATASHCRRCGTESPRDYTYCPKCSAPLVKKNPPMLEVPGQK